MGLGRKREGGPDKVRWGDGESWAGGLKGERGKREGVWGGFSLFFFSNLFKLCKLHSNKHKTTMQPKDDAQALVASKFIQNDI
jgi:hypothetical protein